MIKTPTQKKIYDLEERTALFGEQAIKFAKLIPKNAVTLPMISQFVRSATSIGANYCEADCAESKKDFIHKMGICNKEAKETSHWLRMVAQAVPELHSNVSVLKQEAKELQLIFLTIIKNTKVNIGKDAT